MDSANFISLFMYVEVIKVLLKKATVYVNGYHIHEEIEEQSCCCISNIRIMPKLGAVKSLFTIQVHLISLKLLKVRKSYQLQNFKVNQARKNSQIYVNTSTSAVLYLYLSHIRIAISECIFFPIPWLRAYLNLIQVDTRKYENLCSTNVTHRKNQVFQPMRKL